MANKAQAHSAAAEEQPFHMGWRIRLAREYIGQDISTFAETIGVHRETLSKYETTGAVKPIVLRAIALSTGARLEWLQTGQLPWLREDAGRSVNDLKQVSHGTITDIFTRESL